jgi:hypothetical protein
VGFGLFLEGWGLLSFFVRLGPLADGRSCLCCWEGSAFLSTKRGRSVLVFGSCLLAFTLCAALKDYYLLAYSIFI